MRKYNMNGYNLFVGIEELYGEFLLETDGEPVALNELEDDGCDDIIAEISETIKNGTAVEVTEEDEEYVNDTLTAWGIR